MSWLFKMYEKYDHWIKSYLSYIFRAGMTATSRSETITLYFDGYVNSITILNEFVT